LEIAALKSIIDQSPEAETLVREIFFKLQEKGALFLLKKTVTAEQCEAEIQSKLTKLMTDHCPNVPISELRAAVQSLCLGILKKEFGKNK